MPPPPRLVLADTHVHLYEVFDLDRAFAAAFRNLGSLAASLPQPGSRSTAQFALFLAERPGSQAFERLASLRRGGLRHHTLGGDPEAGSLSVEDREGRLLHILPGRQIVTRDRLEVLALATLRADLPEGEPTADTLRRLESADGLAVLPWAPGKWFGARGRLVRELVESASPDRLLIGDTTLRASGWLEPRAMRTAAARGFGVLAGTDPFPLTGQEDLIGRYATAFEAREAVPASAAGWRRLLMENRRLLYRAGRRDGPISVMRRIVALRFAGRP